MNKNFKVGERWYIDPCRSISTGLIEARITDVTEKTVEFVILITEEVIRDAKGEFSSFRYIEKIP